MDMVPVAVDQESLQGFVLPPSIQTVLTRAPPDVQSRREDLSQKLNHLRLA